MSHTIRTLLARPVLLTAALVFGTLVLGCSSDHVPDENAWRAEREAQIGREIQDWPGYVDAIKDSFCANEDSFSLMVAVFIDEGEMAESLRTESNMPARIA